MSPVFSAAATRPLTRLVAEVLEDALRGRNEVDLREFMDELFRRCWKMGTICMKWRISARSGRIERMCTDAMDVLRRLEKRVIELVNRGGRTVIVARDERLTNTEK